jgi:hypothetical protein
MKRARLAARRQRQAAHAAERAAWFAACAAEREARRAAMRAAMVDVRIFFALRTGRPRRGAAAALAADMVRHPEGWADIRAIYRDALQLRVAIMLAERRGATPETPEGPP